MATMSPLPQSPPISSISVRHWLRIPLLILLGYLTATLPHAQAQSPHVANRAYGLDQVMRVQGAMNSSNGAPNQHSSIVVNQGYVVEVYSTEGNRPQAGIAVYDLSDPSNPRLVSHTDAEGLSEQHAIGFSQQAGHTYTAHLAVDGIAIWDWTDMSQPRQVSRLTLPGIAPGYTHGAWWLSWQAPYLYVSGAGNGIYIVDTTDLAHPRLVDRGDAPNPIPYSQTGGFRVGSIFAVGNLLVASSNDGLGYATLDISDPANPSLLTTRVTDAPPSYSSMLNGYHLYSAGTDDQLHGFDISDPHQIRYVGSANLEGRGGYLTIQDNIAHVGASNHYMKVDISRDGDYKTLGSATSDDRQADEDFAVAVGNLVLISDDHDNGTYIVPHQAEADSTGPSVNMVIPLDGATNQSRATRIGLTFTDLVDLSTLDQETIIVRPLGGETLSGTYSTQTGIVNFAPNQPLEADTTYEVIVPAEGMRDVVGNSTPATFRSTFSTGSTLGMSLWCAIDMPDPVAAGEPLDLTIHTAASPDLPTVRWDYGDNSPIADSALQPTNTHVYNAPGRYSVRATLQSTLGITACTTRATVYRPATAAHPQNSSTIILDSSGTQLWNVNPDNNSVTVIDAVLLKKMGEIAVGRQPRTLAQAPDGTIWTVNQGDATISVLDESTRTLLATIALPRGSDPFGIVFNPRNALAYVSLQSLGQITEIDANSRTVSRTLDVGPTPRALAISADGQRLFITRFISTAEQGAIVEVDPLAWQVRQRIPLVYDPGPDTNASGRGVPNGLTALAISPAGDQLWVGARKSNTARGLQRDGQPLDFESTVRSMLATIDLNTSHEELANRYDFNNRDGPVALRFTPLGDYIFALLEGSNGVDIIDAYTHQLVTSIDNIGHAPQGLVFTEDGSKLFVHSWLTRSVYAYDVSALFGRDATTPKLLAEISTVANDAVPPQVLTGKQIFYNSADPRMSRDGYLSCASCHYDSGSDGQVWDRTAEGEGLRNTISLLGKGSPGHGFMHWSANFDEGQDFENDIRANFGGQGFMPDALFTSSTYSNPLGAPKAGLSPELDALAAYLDSLRQLPPSPFRDPDGSLTADGEAGRLIFIAAGCASCHGGPQFTDSPTGMRHQVGTLTPASGHRLGKPLLGLDTPTLRGLWLTAPYLHDGSAPTLASIFLTRNPLGLYGTLQSFLQTNPRAIDELVAYLLQIDDSEPPFDLASLAVDFVSPTGNTSQRVNQPLLLQVNVSATMGPGVSVDYYANDLPIGTAIGPLYSLTWTPNTIGDYTLTARFNYRSGAATVSTPRHLQVIP
jgi:YVTN family beta-propeller protein